MINRKLKPERKGKIDFKIDEIDRIILPNSVELYYYRKSTLPIVQINLTINAGSKFDGAKHGISNLTSMMIDEGAGGLTGVEISEELDTIGSVLNINSNKDFTTLSILTLTEHFEKSLDILSKITIKPGFAEIDFKRERDRLNAHILQLKNDPAYIASAEINKIIYENTPYQFPPNGTSDSVIKLKAEDVKEFYRERYFPEGSFFSIVGNLEEDKVKESINNYFKEWNGKAESIGDSFETGRTNRWIVFLDKPDAAQSEIRLGHFSKGRKSNDFFARTVLNSILGGQFSSRINLNLREDKGFTYGAHSRYIYNRIGSTFLISTSVQSETTSAALKEILFELESIKSNLSQEEVEFAKSYLIRSYPALFETYSQIAANISLIPIYGLDLNYFNDYRRNIEGVSCRNVMNAANENILLENIVIVVVGNRETIKNDLEEFAAKNRFKFVERTKDN